MTKRVLETDSVKSDLTSLDPKKVKKDPLDIEVPPALARLGFTAANISIISGRSDSQVKCLETLTHKPNLELLDILRTKINLSASDIATILHGAYSKIKHLHDCLDNIKMLAEAGIPPKDIKRNLIKYTSQKSGGFKEGIRKLMEENGVGKPLPPVVTKELEAPKQLADLGFTYTNLSSMIGSIKDHQACINLLTAEDNLETLKTLIHTLGFQPSQISNLLHSRYSQIMDLKNYLETIRILIEHRVDTVEIIGALRHSPLTKPDKVQESLKQLMLSKDLDFAPFSTDLVELSAEAADSGGLKKSEYDFELPPELAKLEFTKANISSMAGLSSARKRCLDTLTTPENLEALKYLINVSHFKAAHITSMLRHRFAKIKELKDCLDNIKIMLENHITHNEIKKTLSKYNTKALGGFKEGVKHLMEINNLELKPFPEPSSSTYPAKKIIDQVPSSSSSAPILPPKTKELELEKALAEEEAPKSLSSAAPILDEKESEEEEKLPDEKIESPDEMRDFENSWLPQRNPWEPMSFAATAYSESPSNPSISEDPFMPNFLCDSLQDTPYNHLISPILSLTDQSEGTGAAAGASSIIGADLRGSGAPDSDA